MITVSKMYLVLTFLALSSLSCSHQSSQEQAPASQTIANHVGPSLADAGGVVYVAPVGTYNGYLVRPNKQYVPASLIVDVKPNSSGTSSTLRGTLRIGFFGGVSIAADNVTFDFATRKLSCVFNNGANGSQVEVSGLLSKGGLTKAFLRSSNPRSSNYNPLPLQLVKDGPSPFNQQTTEINFAVNLRKGKTGMGFLKLSPRLEQQASAGASDLPQIPALTGSFRVNGEAVSSSVFDSVTYDPLTSQMDLVFNSTGRIHFDNISMKSPSATAAPPEISGMMIQGATNYGTFDALYRPSNDDRDQPTLPPKFFQGKLTGTKPYLVYRSVATLDYLGASGVNPAENFFPSFPQMQLKLYICRDDTVFGRIIFGLISSNVLKSEALFRATSAGQNMDFEVRSRTANWSNFSGIVKSPKALKGATGFSSLELSSIPDAQWKGCAL